MFIQSSGFATIVLYRWCNMRQKDRTNIPWILQYHFKYILSFHREHSYHAARGTKKSINKPNNAQQINNKILIIIKIIADEVHQAEATTDWLTDYTRS